jgi:probable HAF family extracellular repeat protein
VNDRGKVVGYGQLADGTFHAFEWTAAGGIVDLGTLGNRYSSAWAVNASGEVTIWARSAAHIARRTQ